MRRKLLSLLLVAVLAISLVAIFAACDKPGSEPESKVVRVSTTTSVNDSGLMDYLRPYFEADTGYKWEIASAGTGAAINAAKYGNADVILVHSKASEEDFVKAGFARKVDGYAGERITFMHNYFVLVGPKTDPAGVKAIATPGGDVKLGFKAISDTQSKFISRGDKSGTHNAEVKLWDSSLGITNDENCAKYDWYVSAGQGMGACLNMANEENAYVLTDKATFLSHKTALSNLEILWEESPAMINNYSMIAVKADAPFKDASGNALPAGTVKIDTQAADVFINWMNSIHARYLIANYGVEEYGSALFTVDELALAF